MKTRDSIDILGLTIDYVIDHGEKGRYGNGIDLHESYPDDEPEVHIKRAEVFSEALWLDTLADHDLPPGTVPLDACRDELLDVVTPLILEHEGLAP